MQRVVRSEPVIPRHMSASERSALADALLEVYAEIFAGATREYVVNGLVEPKAEFSTILLHRSGEGKIVGYFAIHFFERRFRDVVTTVVRSSVGMLRAYRGRNANIAWALGVLLKQRLTHPKRPFYGMGPMVHPSSYLQVVRYVDVFWPRPDEPVPPDMRDFMAELADDFHMPRIDPQQPLVRAGSMPTRETEAERDYWRSSDKPAARFFVAMNPSYSAGNGLLTLFPITLPMLMGIASRILGERTRMGVERALTVAQRLPLTAPMVRPAAVRRHLRAAPLFAGLEDAGLQRVVERASIVRLPAGEVLFREGEPGDELYVVARGAVAVLTGGPGGEEMREQLGSGALAGVISVLASGPRKASARAVIPTTLVRIPGQALRAAMHSAAIGDAIWELFAGRVFDDHLRTSGRHGELSRSERHAWVRRAQPAVLDPGVEVPTAGAAFLLVLRGAVSIDRGAAQLTEQAPKVIEIDEFMRVRAASRACAVRVLPRAAVSAAAR